MNFFFDLKRLEPRGLMQAHKCIRPITYGVDSGTVGAVALEDKGKFSDEGYVDCRPYLHRDGTVLLYVRDFPNFGSILPAYGKSMNDLVAAGDVQELRTWSQPRLGSLARGNVPEGKTGAVFEDPAHSPAVPFFVGSTTLGDGQFLIYQRPDSLFVSTLMPITEGKFSLVEAMTGVDMLGFLPVHTGLVVGDLCYKADPKLTSHLKLSRGIYAVLAVFAKMPAASPMRKLMKQWERDPNRTLIGYDISRIDV